MNIFLAPDRRLRAGWRFAIAFVATIAVRFTAGGVGFLADHSHGVVFQIVSRLLTLLLLLVLYPILGRLLDRDPRPFTSMGLGPDRRLRNLIAGALFGMLIICAAVASIAVAGHVSLHWHWTSATWLPLLEVSIVLLIAAMNEELIFRGYPFQRLLEAIGPFLSVTIMAALFGLIHWSNPNASLISIANTAIGGALFCLAWLRTRSLWFCWAMHFSWNFTLGVLFGLPVSGITLLAVLGPGSAEGPKWLTGGSYGIEAGLSGTAAMLLGLLVILAVTRGSWLCTENHEQKRIAYRD